MKASMRHRLRLIPAVLGVLALAATGCGTRSGQPTAAEIDVRTLDVGSYSTAPLEFRYDYKHTLLDGTRLAVMRLADNMVLGAEIDATLHYLRGSGPILSTTDAKKVLADVNGEVVERNRMLFGWALTVTDREPDREDPEATKVTVSVMQFPDGATAERTARELEQTDFAVAPDLNQNVSIPNTPDAHAHWRPGIPTLGATVAQGSYVINVLAEIPKPSLPQLTNLVRMAFDNQRRLLAALPPLTREDILRLEYDPDRMFSRTLNPGADGAPSPFTQARYNSRGALAHVTEQYDRRKVFEAAGVDRLVTSGSTGATLLFRTRDPAAALDLAGAVLGQKYTGTADTPEAVPNVRCGSKATDAGPGLRYRCMVPYGRYVAAVESDQVIDLHQRAAAQYAILANSY
ncbi:DUF7373 family lipoprotein [Nocardia jiangsuensis]|uniref:Uncharacterized protein n=1 Tax=Nocardia jiangsuensis TaxID=1691563 RepID=A0ABV8DXW2_9NOCA